VAERPASPPPFSTAVEGDTFVLRTGALTLRYLRDSGPFTADNLGIEFDRGGAAATARPTWAPGPTAGNLGGWRRSLDNEQDPQPLHDGLLSRDGWYLLDDSATVLLTEALPGFAPRPAHGGAYQDGYFFGYGLDYARGLADLRVLTGPAPLLPRKAFGVWFSRYWAYSEAELREVVAQFRSHGVPLDTLSLDTDWKRMHDATGCIFFSQVAGAREGDPCSWNGWDWNYDLFPDPAAFLAWAHAEGINIGANIHPSISDQDPRYEETVARSGPLAADQGTPPCTLFQADPDAQCLVFDWTHPDHLAAYFELHAPLAAFGIDFWWLDWCCDGSLAVAPGLSADTLINMHYAREHASRGTRWPAFSRIGSSYQEGKAGIANNGAGAFAEHRYTIHFTGDTCGTWQMLAHEAEFTAAEGAIGMPYVSHDIGSFLGPPTESGCNGTTGHTSHLPDDMYVRWIQFGTFQPLDRLHSHHGDRLPWEYPGAPEAAASEALRLRERLMPYLYTLARQSHDTGLPMARALYLQWPQLDEAYAHPTHYTLGESMLVAPVVAPGDPVTMPVWLPPGTWTDFFSGETFEGPADIERSVALDRYPVFLRAGAIVPTQPDLPTTPSGPLAELALDVWPGAAGRFDLYDDAGEGFAYRQGAYVFTPLSTRTTTAGCTTVAIGPAEGRLPGMPAQRRWTVRLHGVDAPEHVSVGGQPAAGTYDAATRTFSVGTGWRTTLDGVDVSAGPATCSGPRPAAAAAAASAAR
jgi:alpha-glucosidase (family GH31 glycosyl hydrolase)